jgi:hypothetical protein
VHEFFYAQIYFCTSIWICSVYSIDWTLLYMLRRKSCNIVVDVDIYMLTVLLIKFSHLKKLFSCKYPINSFQGNASGSSWILTQKERQREEGIVINELNVENFHLYVTTGHFEENSVLQNFPLLIKNCDMISWTLTFLRHLRLALNWMRKGLIQLLWDVSEFLSTQDFVVFHS